MKKTVKSLIIAASVAAIAGIGAVSFAAWAPNATKDVSVPGNSGEVVSRGIALAENGNGLDGNVLVPYNQDLNNYPVKAGQTAVTVWEITLAPDSSVATGYTVTVAKGDDYSTTLTGKLYVSNANTIDTTKAITDAANSAWKEVGGATAASLAPTSNKIYVVLDSSDTTNDMNQNIQIKITLDDLTA